jgi:hypothetical protein
MRRLAAATAIAAFFAATPARAETESREVQPSPARALAGSGVGSFGGEALADAASAGKGGCVIGTPGVPATLTGFGLILVSIALGHRRGR